MSAIRPNFNFGTETGQLFYSSNMGGQWRVLANFLPPVLSIRDGNRLRL